MPTPEKKRQNPDWEKIESEYRANQLSVSEIGRQYGISHTAINKRAKAQGWTRNLAAKVKEAAAAKLVSDGVSASNARETIEAAASRVVDVVRSHRADIALGRSIAQTLFGELVEATTSREEIEQAIEVETADDRNDKRRAMMLRAVALPSRASTLQSLSASVKTFIQLERQAFNIEAGTEDDPATRSDIGAMVRKLSEDKREQLRSIAAAIAAEPKGNA